jgi:hypothetical protein
MEQQLKNLEKQIRFLRIVLVITFISVAAIAVYSLSAKNGNNEIIRVKGIIVVDENGKERILIGAPVPFAGNRARTDTNKIKEKWAAGMGPGYMNYYKDYNHSCNGIVFLDENGWDKIAIGDPVPDPIIGKRVGPSTGIIYNDDKGLERSGYGVLNVNGQLRVVLGLDHGNGTEGAALSVLPDGSVGFYLDSKGNSIFTGIVEPGHWKSPTGKKFSGIIYQDSSQQSRVIDFRKK